VKPAAMLLFAALMPLCTAAAAPVTAPGGVTVVQQPDAHAELVGTEVLLLAGIDRQTQSQNGLAALVAETILRTPVNPSTGSGQAVPLKDAIAAQGGSVRYVMEPRRVRFYVEALSRAYPQVIAAFHQALVAPDFSAATVSAAKAALNRKIAQNERLALSVGIDMLNRAFYQDSNAGLPPYGLPQTLAGFSPADARAFYTAHYRRGDAVVSAIGNLAAVPNVNLSSIVDGLAAGVSPAAASRMAKLPSTSRQLIAHRDVPVPWLVAQYPAPDLRSRDFGAMLVLTAFMQRTLTDVSEVPTIATRSQRERGVGAYYNFDTTPANVIVYVDGGLGDPTKTFATALTVVNVLGHAKLSGDLTEMKAFAAGRLLEDTQTLEDRAWLAGIYASQHVRGDYLAEILKAIDATTPADLQRVAAQYLGAPTIALVLPRTQ
jgi:predicted Zn-dependent peptidase